MSISSTLAACVFVVAGLAACRSDRTEREGYSRPVESTTTEATDMTGIGAGAASTETPEATYRSTVNETADTGRVELGEPTVTYGEEEAPTPAAGQARTATPARRTPNQTREAAPVEVYDDSDTTSTTAPEPAAPVTPREPASPFSETSSGHGTTTGTGVNTENQGTGGTDDPTR